MRHKGISISQRLRLPAICTLCEQYHQGSLAICSDCRTFLKPLGPCCVHCALPLPEGDFLICGPCCKKKPVFDKAFVAYRFEEPLRTLLHDFKYNEGLYLCSFLADLIADSLPVMARQTQCLIPVPLHPHRLQERGFNQAAELTKQLARLFKLPYHLFYCTKIRATVPQAGLDGTQRRQNLRHAFTAKPMPYHHVTLVDDLLTTGSTANELAQELKNHGVKRVDVWCCARVTR